MVYILALLVCTTIVVIFSLYIEIYTYGKDYEEKYID